MKIIDLLNKIANGEEIPDAIKWGSHDFEWYVYEYKAKGELGGLTLLDYLSQCPQMLNDKIITFNKIEENKIPEKLNDFTISVGKVDDSNVEEYIQKLFEQQYEMFNKINSIIDCLKSKGE